MSNAQPARATPARGMEMKNDLLSKLRAPPLTHSWEFWHDRQGRTKNSAGNGQIDNAQGERPQDPGKYEDRLIHLTSIVDVRGFWSMFNNFDITSLPLRDSVHLFHKGIKPVWEDPRNAQGGSWTFRVPKDKAVEFWKEVCLMAIGEQLQQAVASNRLTFIDDICGVSLSVRFTSILIQVWNRDANHTDGVEKIRAVVIENLPDELKPKESACYYKKHSEHSNFNAEPNDNPQNDPKAGTTSNPSMIQQSGRETYLPKREYGPHMMVEDEATASEIRDHISPPGVVPPGVESAEHRGVRSDEENVTEIDQTLSAMKTAMDRVGESH
ncbi:hypothetical protein MBLNU457_3932t1 [Dothideomycetes sp. NU457]